MKKAAKRVLIKPLITEKLTRIQESENKYAFEVHPEATKTDIKRALKKAYPDVEVTSVNTMIIPGKSKGRFTRSGYIGGTTAKKKKAIVSVKEGQEIDFFTEI